MTSILPFSQDELFAAMGVPRYPASFVAREDAAFWLDGDARGTKRLFLAAPAESVLLVRFEGATETTVFQHDYCINAYTLSAANARMLREVLPWLQPALLGLQTSAG